MIGHFLLGRAPAVPATGIFARMPSEEAAEALPMTPVGLVALAWAPV